MQELIDLAEKFKTDLELEYNADSVKYLEELIERQRINFAGEDIEGLVNACGAFLGQCIIQNYGGKWQHDADKRIAVAFDDKNLVYPFSKVNKQFENGLADSVYSMYTLIPALFKFPPKE